MRGGGSGNGHRVDVVACQQIVEVAQKDCLEGVRRCPPAGRIVVPDGDQLGGRVLAYPLGLLGCMHVPESEDRYRDRIGHREFSSSVGRVPHSAAGPP
jgi:hypothetical protein